MSSQWLLYDGAPIADALVLPHTADLVRLRSSVPQAAHTGVVAGDPCFDRIRASLPRRAEYRAMFGADDRHTVVVLSSTWGSGSLLGSRPDAVRRVMAELPVDTHRVLALIHPNITHGHGPWVIQSWLADCVRAGLVLVPELDGWQAALIAADCVVGDHGSATCLGAAVGRPVLLGAFPDVDVATGSAVDLLGRLAPRMAWNHSVREQINSVVEQHRGDQFVPVEQLVSSVPDESPQRLRALFYDLMRLAEPRSEAVLPAIPVLPGIPAARPSAAVVSTEVDATARAVRLVRWAADVQPTGGSPLDAAGTHLAVHGYHPARTLRSHADLIYLYENEAAAAGVGKTLTGLLTTHPGSIAAAVVGIERCVVECRLGQRIEMTARHQDPVAWASVATAWLHAGQLLVDLAPSMRVTVAGTAVDVTARQNPEWTR